MKALQNSSQSLRPRAPRTGIRLAHPGGLKQSSAKTFHFHRASDEIRSQEQKARQNGAM